MNPNKVSGLWEAEGPRGDTALPRRIRQLAEKAGGVNYQPQMTI